MSTKVQAQPKSILTSFAPTVATSLLQRKCGCGNHTIAGGECAQCSKKDRFGLQTELTVSGQGDIDELEADRLADEVMATPMHYSVSSALPHVQRYVEQANGPMAVGLASVDRVLASSGRPLEPALRQDMEYRFGYDFSQVRIHANVDAEQSARDVNAYAYTVGRDIVFGRGQFAPETHFGKRLLAHELTHVVQQTNTSMQLQRQPAAPSATPVPITPGSDADVREMVNAAIDMFTRSTEYFALARVDQAVLERVLTSWARMATIYPELIQTRLNNDAVLLQSFKAAFKAALRVLLTRASTSVPNTSVIQLYLANLYRLPEWARPDVASFHLTTDAQRQAFITSLTNAFNLTSLLQGYTTVDDTTLQSLLGYLQRLITDSQNLVATSLRNDASLLNPLRSAYRTAVDQLLHRASTTTGQSVQQLFMRYRYGTPALIHEWADQQLAGMTAAAPLGTVVDLLSGNVEFSHNGFQITMQPDGTQTASGAMTHCDMQYSTQIAHQWDGHNRITSFTPPITPRVTIRTDYGPGSSPSVSSGYGRGTTTEDVRLGNTSLGYHERSHSRDFLQFLNANPPPVFTGAIGMTRQSFNAAVTQYVQAMQSYSARINRTSELATDCVGSPNIVQFHTAAGTTTTVACP